MEHAAQPPARQARTELIPIARRAAVLAARLGLGEAGPRELLLAAAEVAPGAFVQAARRDGLDLTRIAWVIDEWLPAPFDDGADQPAAPLNAAARHLLITAARTDGAAGSALLERLLCPPAGDANSPAGDGATWALLRSHGLV
jgi:hypothetical protein